MNGKVWTQEEIDILSRMYPDHFAKEIAGVLGRGVSSVYCKAEQLGLECSPDKIRRSGLMSCNHPKSIAQRFTKGHHPSNKGKKMPPEVYVKVARTMFQAGHTPHNHKVVGSERVNIYGYIEVKVAEPNKWRPKHRVIWEQRNGAIPKGYNVQFKNHNPLDCRIENLYLISKADQMAKENSYYAKRHANTLLALAKKELLKDDVLGRKHLEGYIKGRNDALREMSDFMESHFNPKEEKI